MDTLTLAYAPALRAIREAGRGITAEAIAQATGKVTSNVRRDMPKLRDAGLITIAALASEGAPNTAATVYELAPAGEQLLRGLDIAEGKAADGAPNDGELHANIVPDPNQPRKAFAEADIAELAASIHAKGQLQPILIRPVRDEAGEILRWMIVGGERRWRAIGDLIHAGLRPASEPVLVTRKEMTDAEAAVAAVMENVQRSDLTAVEKLDAYQRLMAMNPDWPEEDATQRLADLIGKSRRHVQDILRLSLLTAAERGQMAAGELTLEQARAQLKNRREVIDMEPWPLLVLAEVFHAANGFDPHPAHYRQADRRPGLLAGLGPYAAALQAEGLIAFSTEPAEDGQYKVGTTVEGWQRLQQLAPDILKADRRSALLALRAKVLGADKAEELDEAGEHATDWLNGPFDLTPEGQAKVDTAAAQRAANEEANRRAAEARQLQDRAREARAARARQLALDVLDADQPASLADHLAEATYPLPWRDSGAGYMLAANGQVVDIDDPEVLPLVMAAMNALAGLPPTFADAPQDGDEEDESEVAA